MHLKVKRGVGLLKKAGRSNSPHLLVLYIQLFFFFFFFFIILFLLKRKSWEITIYIQVIKAQLRYGITKKQKHKETTTTVSSYD